ncbi:hypothetical protein ACKKBF_B32710 [Auxenochlorella protothecoides x Auxenochlorella symbiontica]
MRAILPRRGTALLAEWTLARACTPGLQLDATHGLLHPECRSFTSDSLVRLTPSGAELQKRGTHFAALAPGAAPGLALWSRLVRQVHATFMPAGYPVTVAPGYRTYVAWQGLHHAAGSANGVLASTFLLYALGLGAEAIPTAGAINWVLKDGLGQAGTLLFGRAIAHNFDVNARWWYVASSAKLNLAMGLEIGTALAPAAFLPAAALANALKGLAWMAGGSARAVFNGAFAANVNIADLTAKATSQTIAASLAGTAAGVALAAGVGQSLAPAAAAYAALAALHMLSGVRSVRSVPLATLNPSRVHALGRAFLDGGGAAAAAADEVDGGLAALGDGAVVPADPRPDARAAPRVVPLPSPARLAPCDPLRERAATAVPVGVPRKALLALSPAASRALVGEYAGGLHALVEGWSEGRRVQRLLLHEEANAADALLGCLHACVARNMAERMETNQHLPAATTLRIARRAFPSFRASLVAAGWDVERLKLESIRQRAVW